MDISWAKFPNPYFVNSESPFLKSGEEKNGIAWLLMSLGFPLIFKVPGTLRKINIAMENEPFEDVSPIEHGDFSWLC